jgi:hypothetical protein
MKRNDYPYMKQDYPVRWFLFRHRDAVTVIAIALLLGFVLAASYLIGKWGVNP